MTCSSDNDCSTGQFCDDRKCKDTPATGDDGPYEAVRNPVRLVAAPLATLAGPTTHDAFSHEAQQRRQQRQRDQDGQDDRGRRDQGHDGQERDADDAQRRQGDHHGHAGEEDGTAGCADRSRGGLLGRELLVQDEPSLPVDDEQRVVDSDGEADHEAQDRGR